MRSKEAFAYSRSTGYFCSVATDHRAPCRVTLRRAGACHDATEMERHDKDKSQQKKRDLTPLERWPSRLVATAAEDRLSLRRNPHAVCKEKAPQRSGA